jgi:hypothetical protein
MWVVNLPNKDGGPDLAESPPGDALYVHGVAA